MDGILCRGDGSRRPKKDVKEAVPQSHTYPESSFFSLRASNIPLDFT